MAVIGISSMAMRAWTNSVWLKIRSRVESVASRTERNSMHAIQKKAATATAAKSALGSRQPRLLSPNSRMPAAIADLAKSGCSMLMGPERSISARAAGR